MAGDASRLNGKKGGRPKKKPTPAAAAAATPAPKPAPQVAAPVIDNPHGLSPKELLFVELYTGTALFNASEAYLGAGFKGKPGKVSGLAARLIARDRVAAAVRVRLSLRLRTLQMDGDEALEGISRIGRADIRKLFTPAGNVVPIVDLDDDVADAVASVKVVERQVRTGEDSDGKPTYETEYIKEFKFYDKLKARELMAKADGKLVDRHGFVGDKGELLKPRKVIVEIDESPGAGA